MTFRLKDVQPKTGPVINLKPYNGMAKLRNFNPRIINNRKAIERMRQTKDAQ